MFRHNLQKSSAPAPVLFERVHSDLHSPTVLFYALVLELSSHEVFNLQLHMHLLCVIRTVYSARIFHTIGLLGKREK
jgi:hypothetical protein